MKRLALLAVVALTLSAGQTYAQSIPPLSPRVALDGANGMRSAFATKADANNGKLNNPAIAGGSMDGTQSVTDANGNPQPLNSAFGQINSVTQYGAQPGGTDSGTAVQKAIAASGNRYPVYFPYSANGYTLNTGTYTGREIGTWLVNGNTLSGSALGTPNNGSGTLISPFTNPWLIVSDRKIVYDPASVPQGSEGTTVAVSEECLPNRRNTQNANTNRNWIACRYVGAATGSGGTPTVDISTEVENWVLNIEGNHGLGFELDTNFNDAVTDGQWSTGLFLTGGGATGVNVNSVALSIMHGAYDGSWLPWTVGVSIRQTTNQIQQFKSSASEAGFFQQAFDQSGNTLWQIDKNGYAKAAGFVSMATGNPAFAGKAANADDFVASKVSATDTGFLFRGFDQNGSTITSVDKSGVGTFAGLINTNHTGASSSSSCTYGEMHADDLNLYVCISTGKYKAVALQAIQ